MKGMFSEKQRMVLIAVAFVAAVGAVLWTAKLATRVMCGEWPHVSGGVFGAVGGLIKGGLRGYVGTTESGCQVGSGLLYGVPLVAIVLVVFAGLVILFRIDAYRQSAAPGDPASQGSRGWSCRGNARARCEDCD